MVILRDSSYPDIEGLVRYVYRGEVDVEPERLQSFLRTAEVLKIKGLADQNLSASSEVAGMAASSAANNNNQSAAVEEPVIKEVRTEKPVFPHNVRLLNSKWIR